MKQSGVNSRFAARGEEDKKEEGGQEEQTERKSGVNSVKSVRVRRRRGRGRAEWEQMISGEGVEDMKRQKRR